MDEKPYGGYNFEKPSRAVIAVGLDGVGSVLWWVGGHLALKIESCYCNTAERLDLATPDASGVYVWEGILHVSPGDPERPDDFDSYLVGKFRAPSKEEWSSIIEGRCPWDEQDWKLQQYRAIEKDNG